MFHVKHGRAEQSRRGCVELVQIGNGIGAGRRLNMSAFAGVLGMFHVKHQSL